MSEKVTTETAEMNAENNVETKVDEKAETKAPETKPSFTVAKIKAVAESAWWRKTSEKRIAEKNDLSIDDVRAIRSSKSYHNYVETLMVSQYDEAGFEKWVTKYPLKDMPEVFGERMGIDPRRVPAMIKTARKAYASIKEGKAKMPKRIENPNRRNK